MKLVSNIGWCDTTIGGAVIGCSRVSPGCQFCFAERDTPARVLRSHGIETWGTKGIRHPVAGFAKWIRRLNKLCVCDHCHETAPAMGVGTKCGIPDIGATEPDHCCQGRLRRIRLFADSNSDWLDDRWPIETLAAFLKAIHDAPNVDFQLLTNRPENWLKRMCQAGDYMLTHDMLDVYDPMMNRWLGLPGAFPNAGEAPLNIWLGVSCENQEYADRRIPELLKIPAAVRFVSAEPLLGPIDFHFPWNTEEEKYEPFPLIPPTKEPSEKLDWVIVGGESGKNHRPCEVQWITDIADQCNAAGVPVWVKQAAGNKPGQQGAIPDAYFSLKQTPLAPAPARDKVTP